MGETETDRLKMLEVLCSMDPEPESVPINCLTPIAGTPLANTPPIDVFELVRLIATARIVLPKAKIRLSAGRDRLTREAQALCLFAGANSIFYGDKLLTATNPGVNDDRALLDAGPPSATELRGQMCRRHRRVGITSTSWWSSRSARLLNNPWAPLWDSRPTPPGGSPQRARGNSLNNREIQNRKK